MYRTLQGKHNGQTGFHITAQNTCSNNITLMDNSMFLSKVHVTTRVPAREGISEEQQCGSIAEHQAISAAPRRRHPSLAYTFTWNGTLKPETLHGYRTHPKRVLRVSQGWAEVLD